MEVPFDDTEVDDIAYNIVPGNPVRIKKVTYQAYASSIYSVDNAVEILDYIGAQTDSEDVLPFALRLTEGDEVIQISEDNGEIACGELLSECLSKFPGYNVLVCVSRKVQGCYVSDMIQGMKLRVVKEAALSALENIFEQFTSRKEEMNRAYITGQQLESPVKLAEGHTTMSKKRGALKQELEKAKIMLNATALMDSNTNNQGENASVKRKLNATRGKLVKLSQRLSVQKTKANIPSVGF
jgi:hypothetical protein